MITFIVPDEDEDAGYRLEEYGLGPYGIVPRVGETVMLMDVEWEVTSVGHKWGERGYMNVGIVLREPGT